MQWPPFKPFVIMQVIFAMVQSDKLKYMFTYKDSILNIHLNTSQKTELKLHYSEQYLTNLLYCE